MVQERGQHLHAIGEKLGLCIQYTQALVSPYMLVLFTAAKKLSYYVFIFADVASTKKPQVSLIYAKLYLPPLSVKHFVKSSFR